MTFDPKKPRSWEVPKTEGTGSSTKINPSTAVRPWTKVVASGLVTYLDASNPSSYSGEGHVWKDLTRNKQDATMVGEPSWNPSGYFSGFSSSRYMVLNNSP